MREAKFTKGEWSCRTGNEPVPFAVVYLGNEGGFDISDAPHCQANANLIACAPEMYVMLEVAAKQLSHSPIGYRINKLLAKARGEK